MVQNSAYLLLSTASYDWRLAMSWATRSKPLKWVLAQEPDPLVVQQLSEAVELPQNIVRILMNRQIDTEETIKAFLNPDIDDLKDPFLMHGMEAGNRTSHRRSHEQ